MDLSEISTQVLINNLITLDFRGKEFKQQCLKELLKRNTNEGEVND